jgi:CRP-like cAMP-binding protein
MTEVAAGVNDSGTDGSSEYVVQRLRAVGVLADVGAAHLEELATRFGVQRLRAGETLMREGEEGHEFYVLVEGRLRVDRAGPDRIPVHLGDVVPGECVGETALLRDAPRDATVTAIQPSTVLVLPQDRFRSLLQADPATWEAIEAHIAHRQRWTQTRLYRPSANEVVLAQSGVSRVASPSEATATGTVGRQQSSRWPQNARDEGVRPDGAAARLSGPLG